MDMHAGDWAEMVYELVESAVPGAAREREVGEFYCWQHQGREAQLFCLDERTVVLLTMGQEGLNQQFPWLALNVRKSDVADADPGLTALQILRSIAQASVKTYR